MSTPKKRAVVKRQPPPYVEREFEGTVRHPADSLTVHIGEDDFLGQLADDYATLGEPVAGIFTFKQDGEEITYASPRIYVTRGEPYSAGCADGCCATGEDPAIYLNGYGKDNLLRVLREVDGTWRSLRYRLTGYVPPIVTVRLAHLVRDYAAGDAGKWYGPADGDVTVPLPLAKKWAAGKRLVNPQNEQIARLT